MEINNIIGSMKKYIVVLVFLSAACGSKNNSDLQAEKFRRSMISAETIATLTRITDDSRSIYQVFGPGDTIAFYQRLLLTDAEDTSMYYPEDLIKPYGKNLINDQLYTLGSPATFPPSDTIQRGLLPRKMGEESVYGVKSPDSNLFAYETVALINKEGSKGVHRIYLVNGDSTRQLSYGDTSVFLDRFSNTGRYLSAIYGSMPTWLLIFDIKEDKVYRIEHDSTFVDYLTSFSPSDSMMMFIRSDSKYRLGRDFFGDIWLARFNKSKAP
jgi:hypothetical protein